VAKDAARKAEVTNGADERLILNDATTCRPKGLLRSSS
jgi:hypothetical protein